MVAQRTAALPGRAARFPSDKRPRAAASSRRYSTSDECGCATDRSLRARRRRRGKDGRLTAPDASPGGSRKETVAGEAHSSRTSRYHDTLHQWASKSIEPQALISRSNWGAELRVEWLPRERMRPFPASLETRMKVSMHMCRTWSQSQESSRSPNVAEDIYLCFADA